MPCIGSSCAAAARPTSNCWCLERGAASSSLACRHPAAFSELLQDGSVLGLASLLQHIPLPAQHAGAEQPPAGAGAGPAAAAAGQPAGGSAEASLRLLFQAVEKLGALVDTCSGDEFAHLTQSPGGALLRAFRIAHGQPPAAEGPEAGGAAAATAKLRRSAARFVMLCCDRAQRQQGLQRWQPPRGGAWAAIGAPALQAVLAPREPAPARKDEAPAGGTASPGKENGAGAGQQEETGTDGEGLAKLRKGFLAAAGRGKPKGLQRGAGQAAGAAALHPSQPPVASPAAVAGAAGGRPRVIIEDITDLDQGNPSASAGSGGGEGAAPPSAEEAARLAAAVQREAWEAQQAQQAWLAYQAAEAEKEAAAEAEGAEEELRDVYDSTPSLAVRQARNVSGTRWLINWRWACAAEGCAGCCERSCLPVRLQPPDIRPPMLHTRMGPAAPPAFLLTSPARPCRPGWRCPWSRSCAGTRPPQTSTPG